MAFRCCKDREQIIFLVTAGATLLSALLLWSTILFAPIKILVVAAHEASHAVANVITGGRVSGIEINDRYGGYTKTQGGSRWFTLTAGYIGSVIFGCLLLLSSLVRSTRLAALCLCAALALATPFVLGRAVKKGIRGRFKIMGIGAMQLLLSAGFLGLLIWECVAKKAKHVEAAAHTSTAALVVVGTVSCAQAVFDVLNDTVFNRHRGGASNEKSDAEMFAEEIGGTTLLWGLLWSLLSLGALAGTIVGCLHYYGKRPVSLRQMNAKILS